MRAYLRAFGLLACAGASHAASVSLLIARIYERFSGLFGLERGCYEIADRYHALRYRQHS